MSRRRRVIDAIAHLIVDRDHSGGRIYRVGEWLCYTATEVPSRWLG